MNDGIYIDHKGVPRYFRASQDEPLTIYNACVVVEVWFADAGWVPQFGFACPIQDAHGYIYIVKETPQEVVHAA